jgi:hypothetical protein
VCDHPSPLCRWSPLNAKEQGTMTSLQNFDYKGKLIQSRMSDGFVNLTQMCQANGKRLDNWTRLKQTQSYARTLANSLGCEVVDSLEGSSGGTWGHKSLAINLARWISDEFAVWCDAHILRLMEKGETSLSVDPLEELKLKHDLARLENERVQAELKILQFKQYVVTTLPEPIQQKVLGYQVVKEIEYRDRVIKDGEIINHGETVSKDALCRRYGLMTRTGSPNYKLLNVYLDELGITNSHEMWKSSVTFREIDQFKREFLSVLDEKMLDANRQLFIGE